MPASSAARIVGDQAEQIDTIVELARARVVGRLRGPGHGRRLYRRNRTCSEALGRSESVAQPDGCFTPKQRTRQGKARTAESDQSRAFHVS
jgi:hypothetical protein